jgi:hypothetical protein
MHPNLGYNFNLPAIFSGEISLRSLFSAARDVSGVPK